MTAIDINYSTEIYYNSAEPLVAVYAQPAAIEYRQAANGSNVFWIAASQDIPNMKFTSLAAGLAYIMSGIMTSIVSGLNGNTNIPGYGTFTAGVVLENPQPLEARLAAMEAKLAGIKVGKIEAFTVTTDANGDFSLNTSVTFTSPKIVAAVQATAGAEGYHVHPKSVSGTTITGRAFKNKTQGVLIGGTIDPDSAVAASTTIHVIVVESI